MRDSEYAEESLGFAYTVWVGGVEVSDHYLNFPNAVNLANIYREYGYEDVVVDAIKLNDKTSEDNNVN